MAKDLKLIQSEEGIFFGTFNDIKIENHDMKLIQNPEKIAQDVTKILLIEKGGNFLFPGYGTLLPTLINERKVDTISEEIVNEITYALTYVKQINRNENINIDELESLDINDVAKGFELVINIRLTNGELLTIKKDYAR